MVHAYLMNTICTAFTPSVSPGADKDSQAGVTLSLYADFISNNGAFHEPLLGFLPNVVGTGLNELPAVPLLGDMDFSTTQLRPGI